MTSIGHLFCCLWSLLDKKTCHVCQISKNLWFIDEEKGYILNLWKTWSALIRNICRSHSRTSERHQQLSELKPVHADHVSHYSHNCHVNGGDLHCCGTAGHCLRLSVQWGAVNLLNNCCECIPVRWDIWLGKLDTLPHGIVVVMMIWWICVHQCNCKYTEEAGQIKCVNLPADKTEGENMSIYLFYKIF